MPKEIIQSLPGIRFVPEVRWGRDASVQLATIDLEMDESDPARGMFADMDRGAINRLIQVLRRARDQAYGRDE